jgi:CelD/BcsL family acetyltransferase involved in cellulose biosynthesis
VGVAGGTGAPRADGRASLRRVPENTPAYVVAREDALDFLSTAYRDLYHRSTATLFQHPVWLDRLYTTLAPRRRAQRVVVTIRTAGSDRLVGVLPLVLRRRRGLRRVEFADLGVCDYAAPVLDRAHAVSLLLDPAVRRGVRAALGRFDLLQVERLAGSAAEAAALLGASVTRRHSYDAHAIALPASVTGWPGDVLGPSMVRRLEQKRKRVRPKGGATLRVVRDVTEVDDLMARMRDFRRDRFAGRRVVDLVQDPECFEFYRRAAVEGITAGGPARLAVLEVGGEPAAVALDLVDTERHLFLLVGYDVVRLRNCSLGLLIIDELVRSALDEGLHTFDLTVGDEPYKADFGAQPTPMYAVRLAVTSRGRVAASAADLDAAARRLAKRVLAARERARRPASPAPVTSTA